MSFALTFRKTLKFVQKYVSNDYYNRMFVTTFSIPKSSFLSVQLAKKETSACWHTLLMAIIIPCDFKTMQKIEAVYSSHIQKVS